MACTIVHLLDVEAPNGVYSMLDELYWAISKYHPKYKQKVVISGNDRLNPDFVLEKTYVGNKHLLAHIEKIEKPVVIFHKLMVSDAERISDILFEKIPFIILNHTFSNKFHYIGKCDALVSVSEYMHKYLSKLFPSFNNVCIRNGVNQNRYESAPVRDYGSFSPENYFFTGRINALNNHKYSDDFIEWMSEAELPKKMVHEYIGKGNYFHQAKRLAKSLYKKGSPNKCQLLGPIYDFNRKLSFLKSWNLFVYEINRHEGTSMSVLESLACGIPVVCSNHHGNKDLIIPEVNGFVYESRKEATKFISRCINDTDFLNNIKKTTKEHFAQNLDMKIAATKYVELCESLAKG